MQAIILAAGMGKRLKELTKDNTKCMVKVNGVALIDRMLHQLDALALQRIVLVVGYEGQKLKDYVETLSVHTPIDYVENPIYDKTNNIYSLYLAKDYLLTDDTLLLESDLIFEDELLQMLIEDPRDTLALVDRYESWMDGTCVKLNEDDTISAFVPGKKFVFQDIPHYYKTVNIYKFSKEFSQTRYVPFLDAYSKALGNNEYYEQVLRVITMLDDPGIKAKCLNGQKWYEIDDIQDLNIAESIFSVDDDMCLQRIQQRYGGYWRYPHMLDFCYLVNPHYPPQKLMDEMRASFEKLLTQYPSGQSVNSLLAAKNFGVSQKHIVVGNGAAELIACLTKRMTGTVGVIRPTYEEYPNRLENPVVEFLPQNRDYSYTASDLMGFFGEKDIQTLILINPDNPSGNYIPKAELLPLVEWCKERHITCIIDESFADFAEEPDNTLLRENILTIYPNLVVVKSISKSYGVPGLRLGALASGDENLISQMKKDTAIWNINSFAEFYMQIAEKYKSDYAAALAQFLQDRKELLEAIEAIPDLRAVPTQANFVMIELLNGLRARELAIRLLKDYNIFIKDLSSKIYGKEYIRVAIREKKDNDRLLEALRMITSC